MPELKTRTIRTHGGGLFECEFRKPKALEHYISGALPEVYTAINDLSSEYWVIKERKGK